MGEEVDKAENMTTMINTSPDQALGNNDSGLHFVLVHGFFGGCWCWYKIRCLLQNSGFKVSCIDLKSCGIDPTHVDSVCSFDGYNQPLFNFLSSLANSEQVILVGHSAGGLSVTQASRKFGKKIRLAVYLAAVMLKFGFCSPQDQQEELDQPITAATTPTSETRTTSRPQGDESKLDLSSIGDDVYELGFGLGTDHPPTSALVKKEFLRNIFYHMSPQEDFTLASMLMRPGPLVALTTANFEEKETEVDRDNIDKVPRVYIKTMHDQVIKPQKQDAMIERWPPSQVYVLDSDHSPFFSSPFLLVGLLLKAAASVGVGS